MDGLSPRYFDTSKLSGLRAILAGAESAAADGPHAALNELRKYCLTDFCELLLALPDPALPNMSRALPGMPAAETQKVWTNSSGHELLQDTIGFARLLQRSYESYCSRPLGSARILDYGCGFGRVLRAMLYFAEPENLFGVDPWPRSISTCREFNVLATLAESEYMPALLPFDGPFDLVYAYSVLTHLGESAARASFAAIRRHTREDGLLALTIRPLEFWRAWGARHALSQEEIETLISRHLERGFAFLPRDTEVDGELVYGTATMSAEWIERLNAGWSVAGYDRGADYWQNVLFLRPR